MRRILTLILLLSLTACAAATAESLTANVAPSATAPNVAVTDVPATPDAPPATSTSAPPTEAATATTAPSTPTIQPTATAPPPTSTPLPPTPTSPPPATPTPRLVSGAFVKEEVNVAGSYTFDPASGVIRFSPDFSMDPGIVVVVTLSGAADLTTHYSNFTREVMNSPSLVIGPLQSLSGAQEYTVPPGTDLSPYRTLVIWCQAVNVALAAAPFQP